VMTDGRPFCCVCYERLYAARCATCHQTIHISDGHMVHGARRWHAVDACFRCDSCSCSLLGCPFVAVPNKDAVYCANCGITCNAMSYVDRCDSAVGGNCLSPCSPMMKVQAPNVKAFSGRFEGADGKRNVGWTWSEESPVKVAASFVSPRNSPLQCKPLAAELPTHSACADLASCCDDHRLSAEFQVCANSRGDRSNDVLASSHLTRISPAKNSVIDLGSAAQTNETDGSTDAKVGITNPRPPMFSASGADLDNADEISVGLEELIVEPLWSRSEPDGVVAEDTEVVAVADGVCQKSRKSKNLNVRFDPSTKDPSSPMTRDVYCEHWRPSSRRSLDDSDIPYVSCGSRCHAAGIDGSASVRIRRRRSGYGRHRVPSDIRSDVDTHGGENRRAHMNRGSGWWMDVGDDYDDCSTCSSSSSDSIFDYGDTAMASKGASVKSQTLPQRRHNAASVGSVPLNQTRLQRSKKHKKKHCVVS